MNLHNGSPQVRTPIPDRVSSIYVPGQNEHERASSAGKNGMDMETHDAVSEPIRSTVVNTIDRDLWAAGQSITAYRQERMAIYRALDDATAARTSLEHSAASVRKKYNQAKAEYHQLFKSYKALCEQHGGLQQRHEHVCSDLARALDDQRKLQTITVTLEEEKALKDALELELQRSKDELAALEDWKCQELRSRDLTIDKLQGDIQAKDSELAHLAEKLESLNQQQNRVLPETMGDTETKDAQIARLMAEGVTYKQDLHKEQDQVAALSSELESAKLCIQVLQEVQSKMEEKHLETLQHLRQENDNLKENLDGMRANDQLLANSQEAIEKADTEFELLHNENILLAQQIEAVKKTLVARFPGLNDNLDNLSAFLAENEEDKKRKKRKVAK